MDEKCLLGRDLLGIKHRRTASIPRSGLWIALFTILCVAIFKAQWVFPSGLWGRPMFVVYDGGHIKWVRCGDLKGRSLECSSITVPMDQFDSEYSGDRTFTLPPIRMRGKNASQNLLLNPGGPGGSGVEFIYRRGEHLSTIVGEGFHLLSFDPRGVNNSKPMASCYPDDEARREWSRVTASSVVHDSLEVYA